MKDLQIVKLENTDVTSWNFAMLKEELQSRLDFYKGIIYTDDTIKDAKTDRTTLNKVKKAIEDARKSYKARCLAPYEALEPQIKELVEMVEEQRLLIDETVKDYETRQKEQKEVEVKKYYDRKASKLGIYAESLYKKLFDKKWVNASTTRAKYEEGVINAINGAATDLSDIRAMESPFVDTLLEIYAETLSMELVKAKKEELEEIAKKANLATAEEVAIMTDGSEHMMDNTPQIKVNPEGGTVIKVYARQAQLNQISDFMKALGVRYELL